MEKIKQLIAAFKVWKEKSGLLTLWLIPIAVAAILLPLGKFLSGVVFGAALCLFLYINWNKLRKITKEQIDKIRK